MTQGAAEHTEKFSHYEEMPRELAKKVADAYKASREENWQKNISGRLGELNTFYKKSPIIVFSAKKKKVPIAVV